MTSEKEDPWFTHQQAQLSLARSFILSLTLYQDSWDTSAQMPSWQSTVSSWYSSSCFFSSKLDVDEWNEIKLLNALVLLVLMMVWMINMTAKKDKGMWNERTKKERSDANDFFAIEFSKLIDGSGFVMDYWWARRWWIFFWWMLLICWWLCRDLFSRLFRQRYTHCHNADRVKKQPAKNVLQRTFLFLMGYLFGEAFTLRIYSRVSKATS